HGDTTPYYIVAVEDYVRSTGDFEFLRVSWPSLLKAYEWCLTTDADGDGLMDNARAGLGALEFGSLTGIQTDIYLAAVWARAAAAMRTLAGAMGDGTVRAAADKAAVRAARAFDAKFWDAERGWYSYAFAKDSRLVQELTPWSAVGVAWGLGAPGRGVETMAALNGPDMTTDWGVRMLSARSPLFEPLNYDYGAVWPFLNGWVSMALFKYDFTAQAFGLLRANVRHGSDNALGAATELYSGALDIWPQEGVPHQGFSTTSIVLPFVRGLLGLDADALAKELRFEPAFPADWPTVSVTNWKAGGRTLSLDYERRESKVLLRVRSEGNSGLRLVFRPALGPGTVVRAARLNGAALAFRPDTSVSGQAVRPSMELPLRGDDTVELEFVPAPEIVPPGAGPRPGDVDRGLKIVRVKREGLELRVTVEGLSGEAYVLEIANSGRVDAVAGGAFDGRRLTVAFPAGKPGEFLRRDLVIRAKG
ncbi:MAG TPA: GH116 family glycosyl hydrolase, partial [Terriglobales bacterium]|nr:GH116 family glycosyl hydrolase [Terriglobales bacterium]